MNKPGKHFLAGSTFPGNHDCRITAGHLGRQLEHPLTDRILGHRLIAGFFAPAANNLADSIHQETRLERLHKVINGSGLHGRHRVADLTIGRDQHHWQPRIQPLDFGQQLMPRQTRHVDIADHHIHRSLRQSLKCLTGIGRFPYPEFGQFKGGYQRLPQVMVVLNNQNLGLGHGCLRSVSVT